MQSTTSSEFTKEPTTLTIRVMKLSRPQISMDGNISYPIQKEFESSSQKQVFSYKEDVAFSNMSKDEDLRLTGLSDVCMLSNSLGNRDIYLGETFGAYICLMNNSSIEEPIYNVTLKVELQTSSHKHSLYDNFSKPISVLEKLQVNVKHDIKELGLHVLVCSVTYSNQHQEQKFARSFFKFSILNPMSIKTKVNTIPFDRSVFFEVQITNLMPNPIFLETMKMEASEIFKVQELNSEKTIAAIFEESEGPKSIYMFEQFNPLDSRQYLFKLTPRSLKDSLVVNLGKIDLFWRSSFGETGQLQTNTITRKPLSLPLLSAIPIRVEPSKIYLESVFTITLRIFNNSEHPFIENMLINPSKSKSNPIVILGPLPILIRERFSTSYDLDLKVVCLSPGFQSFGNIKFIFNGNQSVDISSIMDLFVYTNELGFVNENKLENL